MLDWLGVIEFFKHDSASRIPQPSRSPEVVPVTREIVRAPVRKGVWDVGVDFKLDPSLWVKSGDRDVILASSGMGKSYLAGVLMEEVLECGGMVFVIDPEGENWTLAERYPVTVVGGGHRTVKFDLDGCSEVEMDRLVRWALQNGVSLVFDLSERTVRQQQLMFARIGVSVFGLMDNVALRRPVKFMVEEARLFAPQKGSGLPMLESGETCLSVFEDIATRGRKRGLNMLVATQRPSAISKDILSQCNRWWFGGVKSTQDCKALGSYLDEAGISVESIRALSPGEFYFYGGSGTVMLKVRNRKCRHGGETCSVSDKVGATQSEMELALVDFVRAR